MTTFAPSQVPFFPLFSTTSTSHRCQVRTGLRPMLDIEDPPPQLGQPNSERESHIFSTKWGPVPAKLSAGEAPMVGWTPSRASLPPFLSLPGMSASRMGEALFPSMAVTYPTLPSVPRARHHQHPSAGVGAANCPDREARNLGSGSDNPAPSIFLGSIRIPGPRPPCQVHYQPWHLRGLTPQMDP